MAALRGKGESVGPKPRSAPLASPPFEPALFFVLRVLDLKTVQPFQTDPTSLIMTKPLFFFLFLFLFLAFAGASNLPTMGRKLMDGSAETFHGSVTSVNAFGEIEWPGKPRDWPDKTAYCSASPLFARREMINFAVACVPVVMQLFAYIPSLLPSSSPPDPTTIKVPGCIPMSAVDVFQSTHQWYDHPSLICSGRFDCVRMVGFDYYLHVRLLAGPNESALPTIEHATDSCALFGRVGHVVAAGGSPKSGI
uniref:Uncharacterized protein n=1 Tax=Florenciella parvula TaxID=236787 RepID=A0A7S2FBP1_9STRA|mmetsp:Transcript_12857/g.27087  ORF Transcript_12857/g.27087 Transcript_12857/m.27087 type:complete len:251 (+) Transcript_12857:66-818(+)|eukprot:CAMPEP_0182527168 /NCGR_PEP_ID=MMETSP1323-20130603/3677_1 /TAXON_ID=236787 /ORGANISM="Florenciella parvula, Strain RCC1693" /LENGTH=250 /DNA_ID=CAMNT_0024736131 /DNA_START=61 /DNA_END=813 /DNA_ORIENTATION=-